MVLAILIIWPLLSVSTAYGIHRARRNLRTPQQPPKEQP